VYYGIITDFHISLAYLKYFTQIFFKIQTKIGNCRCHVVAVVWNWMLTAFQILCHTA